MMLFLAAATVLATGCLVPNRWLPPLPNDKLMHFAGFALLGVIGLRMAQDSLQVGYWLAGLLVLGWVIECLQSLVPDRAFCWRDMGANAAGLVFAAVCTQIIAVFA